MYSVIGMAGMSYCVAVGAGSRCRARPRGPKPQSSQHGRRMHGFSDTVEDFCLHTPHSTGPQRSGGEEEKTTLRPHRSPRTQATCAYIDFDPPIASRPPKSSTKSDRFSTRPGLPPRRVTGFVNERASSNRNHGASLANSYSARAHCRVISEIDTGLRNLRTCNQWVVVNDISGIQ